MSEIMNQGKGRVVGMDIHPTVFSASALENTSAQAARELFMHDQRDMDDLERWYKKHSQSGDIYVMESCNNSFETYERLRVLLVQAARAILRMAPSGNNPAAWGRAMVYRKGRNVAAIAVAESSRSAFGICYAAFSLRWTI